MLKGTECLQNDKYKKLNVLRYHILPFIKMSKALIIKINTPIKDYQKTIIVPDSGNRLFKLFLCVFNQKYLEDPCIIQTHVIKNRAFV